MARSRSKSRRNNYSTSPKRTKQNFNQGFLQRVRPSVRLVNPLVAGPFTVPAPAFVPTVSNRVRSPRTILRQNMMLAFKTCRDRKERRRAIFASNRSGQNGQSRRKLTPTSFLRC